MAKYLFFDTETNGLPVDPRKTYYLTDNWAHIIQLAWVITNEEGVELEAHDLLIKPTFEWSMESQQIHGITQSKAKKLGLDSTEVLERFETSLNQIDYLVAHNIWFDINALGAEFIRNNKKNPMLFKKKICTLQASRIIGKKLYNKAKGMTLTDLHTYLIGNDFGGAHDALNDTRACVRCYFKMREQDVLQQPDNILYQKQYADAIGI